MAVPFSNTKLRVPKGFQNILEGLAREVLRSQPKELYGFGCQYFETLLKVREETGHDPAVHGAKLEDRFYNNDTFKSPSVDPSNPQQQDAALTIQTNYRQHAAKEEVQEMREEDAATTIQAGVRGYIDRQKVLEEKDPEEFKRQQDEAKERLAARESATAQEEEEEVDIDLTDPDVEKAAIKIQAGFKGFKARKGVQETKDTETPATDASEKEKEEEEEIDIDLNDPEVEKAATKIQASFKGHKARMEVKAKKENQQTEEAEEAPADVAEEKPAEEEIDIDLDDPNTEKAAVMIQAQFRGFKTRKDIMTKKDSKEDVPEEEAADTSDLKQEEEEVDIDLTDPEVEKAAVKIQSGFKGYKARKEMKKGEETADEPETTEEKTEEAAEEKKTEEEEEVDIDLTDPEVEKAALKIQAGFKGFKARKDQDKKEDDQ